jgi:HPt (histidine-containing phosphotransfer) domain-containing protein
MDDYLSKPLLRAALHGALNHAIDCLYRRGQPLEPMPEPDPSDASADTPRQCPLMDGAAALGRVGGDSELLGRMAAAFCADLPAKNLRLSSAVAGHDAAALESVAHSFRGGFLVLSADRAAVAAGHLERAAGEGKWSEIGSATDKLRREIAALLPCLVEIAEGAAVDSPS